MNASRRQVYAFIFLAALSLILTSVSLLYTAHVNNLSVARDLQVAANTAAINHHTTKDAQLRAALCSVLPALQQHAEPTARPDFTQLARILHCRKGH